MPLWPGIHRSADIPVIHSEDQLSTDCGLGTVLASEYNFRQYKCSLLSVALSLVGVTSIKQIIMQVTAVSIPSNCYERHVHKTIQARQKWLLVRG